MSDSEMRAPVNSDSAFNYIRRRGRFTKAQTNARDTLSGQYRWQPDDLRYRPLGMEIGFGMGFELIAWAEQRPERRLLGVSACPAYIGADR